MTPPSDPILLDERKSAILRVLVEHYTRLGQPVSSRAVLESGGLDISSATIRNELVALERDGFLYQPHTSAGRVPTDLGYRYYVDHLAPLRLRTATRERITTFFATVHEEIDRLLQQTSDLVADLTHYPAVVVGPGLSNDTIHAVNLVRLGPEVVMLVLVSESGRVVKEIARLPVDVGADQVAKAESLLAEAICGRRLSDALTRVKELESGRREVRVVVRAAAEVAVRAGEQTHGLYMGGTGQLAELWADISKLHRILEFIETEQAVMSLLEDSTSGTSVRIGSELPGARDMDLAVVSRSFDIGPHDHGRVGVLGPKRMDYRRTIRVVEEVGDGLGDTLTAG